MIANLASDHARKVYNKMKPQSRDGALQNKVDSEAKQIWWAAQTSGGSMAGSRLQKWSNAAADNNKNGNMIWSEEVTSRKWRTMTLM